MDPTRTIGLAAVIGQFAELGIKVVQRVSDFNRVGDEVPKAFKQIATALPLTIDGLQRIINTIEAGDVDETTQKALGPVVQQCLDETKEIDSILHKALPSAGASSWERRRKAVASLRHDSKLQEAVDSLSGYIMTLTFHQSVGRPEARNGEEVPPQPKPFWLVPFDRNVKFFARKNFFEDIEHAFTEASQPKAALCGLGGIGKSQIALEYCYRKRENNQCSVFWVNAATVDRFEESFKRIASECGLVSREDSGSDAAFLLKSWLEVRHEGPWLMVIDNVDEEDVFFREKMKIGKTPSELIPCCQQGSLLFTTRSRDIAVDLANPAVPIVIHEMDEKEGMKLVRGRLGDDQTGTLVLELLDALEYIPLAITQAIAFMAKRRMTIQKFLEQFRKSDSTMTKLLSHEFLDHARQSNTMESVAKTWMISFQSIRDSNERAADLLCLINFFQHQGIPALLLQDSDEDEFDFQDAVALLKAFSFVDTDENDTVFSTHRLVQLATRWWLEKETPGKVDGWAAVALKSIAAHFPEPTSHHQANYFQLSERLLPHAEIMIRHQFKYVNETVELTRAKLLNSTGRYLYWNGNYDEGQLRFRRAMQMNHNYLGEKHINTMTSTGFLGWAMAVINRDPQAIPLLERLVEIRIEVLGEDDPTTIDALSDLAMPAQRACSGKPYLAANAS